MENSSCPTASCSTAAPSGRGSSTVTAKQELAQSIERVVRSRTGGQIRGLRVEVGREGVLLQGRSPTFYCKQLAQHAAMDLAGSAALTNDIEVR